MDDSLLGQDLYQILLTCWSADPDDRPSFRGIAKFFKQVASFVCCNPLPLARR
jgi:hypothetical protein